MKIENIFEIYTRKCYISHFLEMTFLNVLNECPDECPINDLNFLFSIEIEICNHLKKTCIFPSFGFLKSIEID